MQTKFKSIHLFNLFMLLLLASCGGSKTETPAPKPTAEFSFSPSNPTTNDEITFTATTTNAKTFVWASVPAGVVGNAATLKTKITTAGTYQVSLTATGDGGSIVATKTLTVSSPVLNPAGDFSFSPSNVVAGQPVTFTATAQNAVSFEWSSSPAGLSSTQQNPTATFANAGNYQITLRITGAAGSTPIVVTKTITVASSAPVADFTFSPTTITAGQQVSFTATATNATSFAWSSVPAGFASTQQNPTYTFVNAGTYQVTLVASGAGGNTTVTKAVTVAASSLTAAFRFEPTQPKAGERITFIYTGTGASTYEWSSLPIGFNATTASANYTFNTAGSYTVILTVRDAFGNVQRNTQTVTVATASTGGGTGCQDENKCNLPKCYITKTVLSVAGGTTTGVFEYTTVAGVKVVSKLTLTSSVGVSITNTSLYEYDSQARNTKITTTTQNPFAPATTSVTEHLYNGCQRTRTNNLSSNVLQSYSTYEYDGSGRLVKTLSYNASNQLTGQNIYSNFTAEGQPQNEDQLNSTGAVTAKITTTYQNCQPLRVIGRDAAGNIATDLTGEFFPNRMLSKTTVISNTPAGSVTAVNTYEYQCD